MVNRLESESVGYPTQRARGFERETGGDCPTTSTFTGCPMPPPLKVPQDAIDKPTGFGEKWV